MMKYGILTGAMVIAMMAAVCAEAGVSQTKGYRMTVTIPAIVGVNTSIDPSQDEAANRRQDVIASEDIVIRDGESVLLRTTVVR